MNTSSQISQFTFRITLLRYSLILLATNRSQALSTLKKELVNGLLICPYRLFRCISRPPSLLSSRIRSLRCRNRISLSLLVQNCLGTKRVKLVPIILIYQQPRKGSRGTPCGSREFACSDAS